MQPLVLVLVGAHPLPQRLTCLTLSDLLLPLHQRLRRSTDRRRLLDQLQLLGLVDPAMAYHVRCCGRGYQESSFSPRRWMPVPRGDYADVRKSMDCARESNVSAESSSVAKIAQLVGADTYPSAATCTCTRFLPFLLL